MILIKLEGVDTHDITSIHALTHSVSLTSPQRTEITHAILHRQDSREHITSQDDEDDCEAKKAEVATCSKEKINWPD